MSKGMKVLATIGLVVVSPALALLSAVFGAIYVPVGVVGGMWDEIWRNEEVAA